MVKFVKKRDGRIDRFDTERIRKAVSKASRILEDYESASEIIYKGVMDKLEFISGTMSIAEIETLILETAQEKGYKIVADAYRNYRDKRAEARKILAIASDKVSQNSTDAALLIESDSQETLGTWNRNKIIEQLEDEAGLSADFAKEISKRVENIIIDMYLRGIRKFSTIDIRAIVDLLLREEGLEKQRRKQALLCIPSKDFESIVFTKSSENSNVASHNPEALNLEIAERIQKQYALEHIFSEDVASAHLNGAIHLHDLGYPARAYCSSHSVEYIKKYGLNQVLANLEAKSSPPNSASVLNQHIQTFLASLQAHYAGALGFGFLNILYAPLINRPVDVVRFKLGDAELTLEKKDFQKLEEQGELAIDKVQVIEEKRILKEMPEREMLQIAQNLIFASSQNAFSRGGQTLFIDFNIHLNVPHYMKNVPAIGPGGKYLIELPDKSIISVDNVPRFMNKNDSTDTRNGDADSSQLSAGKIITYGDMEKTAQKFAKVMMEVWRRGDKYGRPFHFPKCDLHVDKECFENPEQRELLDFAFKVSAENGSVYFMFDRGDGAVLAQCCRLKERVTDPTMLKYPEKLRFCGFQNVTVNIAQASYKGKDLKGTFREIDAAMEIALKAHKQKAVFIQKLLDTDGTPMRNLGLPSDDGLPYIDLKKSTYII